MYTYRIQPVSETKGKQLRLWKDLILQYHLCHKQYVMVINNFIYFENKTIKRKCTSDDIIIIIEYLIEQGEISSEVKTELELELEINTLLSI